MRPGIVTGGISIEGETADVMHLWGREWTRAELESRIGSQTQLGGVTRFEFSDGKARGISALRVRTARGLEFSVLPERGLDIFDAWFQGKSLCWHSPAGLSHPAYYDPRQSNWLRTFPGGLLTTCGLSSAGAASVDLGEEIGLHGSISNTPAEHVSWSEEWLGDELLISIRGRIRESSVFGPNLVNHRTIGCTMAGHSIHVHDRIINEGHSGTPLMLIYHCNFGFPLLSERSRIYCRSKEIESRNQWAEANVADWSIFNSPDSDMEERCYYHRLDADDDGKASVVLVDDHSAPKLAIELRYSSSSLPRLVEWKSTQPRHYVLGLEPANCKADGRKTERQAGTLIVLEPGQSAEMHLEFRVLVEPPEIEAAIASCDNPHHKG